jgi:hypothetical protein
LFEKEQGTMPERQFLDRLTELAKEERKLRLLWGLSRWLTVMVAALAICCFTDWLIDLWYDTPSALRIFIRIALIGLATSFFYWWVIRPIQSGLDVETLALWVEERYPQFGHRLISAVQFADPDAKRGGMSAELIDVLTAEAESSAAKIRFTELLDTRRQLWSRYAFVSLSVIVLAAFFTNASLLVLLARQLGSNERISRSTFLEAKTATLWPSGEPVTLRFLVSGRWSAEQKGSVEIFPEDQPSETYVLTFSEEGPTSGQAIFTATVPASSRPFSYRAWLGDGRTYEMSQVTFTPRPILVSWEAWLQLPTYIGVRPDGKCYEVAQSKGDLQPIPGSSARIEVVTKTPIVESVAEILGPIVPDLGAHLTLPVSAVSASFLLQAQRAQGWTPNAAGPLFTLHRYPLKLNAEGTSGSAAIEIPFEASAYRIVVKDQNGFTNRPIPRRGINFKADELPQVALLPERFGLALPSSSSLEGVAGGVTNDLDLEGMPVPLGRPLHIAYRVHDDFVLNSARLRYRINDGDWQQLTLDEKSPPNSKSVFDLDTGAFDTSGSSDQVPFFAIPSSDVKSEPGRAQGGGRFDFQTRAIPGLKLGDVLEYFIEVKDRHPDPLRPSGRSPVRRKTVVTEAQFVEWVVQTLQQENRLRQLERQQRRVFEPPGGP